MVTGRDLVRVPFHGDMLEAVEQDGKVWVSLRRCCENLGVALNRQTTKLKGKPWAVVNEMFMAGADGKTYTMTMVDLDTLPGWLFSIDARKVKEDVREKLARYQREAAKVLANHFLRREPATPAIDPTTLVTAFRPLVEELVRRTVRESTPAPQPVVQAVPRATVAERCRYKGWLNTSSRQRQQIRRLANALLDLRHSETPDVWGQCHVYYGHQLLCLDEAIDRVREVYLDREKAAGSHLFTVG